MMFSINIYIVTVTHPYNGCCSSCTWGSCPCAVTIKIYIVWVSWVTCRHVATIKNHPTNLTKHKKTVLHFAGNIKKNRKIEWEHSPLPLLCIEIERIELIFRVAQKSECDDPSKDVMQLLISKLHLFVHDNTSCWQHSNCFNLYLLTFI